MCKAHCDMFMKRCVFVDTCICYKNFWPTPKNFRLLQQLEVLQHPKHPSNTPMFADAPDRICKFFHVSIVMVARRLPQIFFRDGSEQQHRPARIGSRCDRLACEIYTLGLRLSNKRQCNSTVGRRDVRRTRVRCVRWRALIFTDGYVPRLRPVS